MIVTNINSPAKNSHSAVVSRKNFKSNQNAVNFGYAIPGNDIVSKQKANLLSIAKTTISRIFDALLPWGKGRHLEEVIEDGKIVGNKYLQVDDNLTSISTTYTLKNRPIMIEKMPIDGKWIDIKKYDDNGNIENHFHLEGSHSLLTEYDQKGRRTNALERFPDDPVFEKKSFFNRKFNPKNGEMIEMTQSFPENGSGSFALSSENSPVHSVTEYYHYNNLSNETKTEKRFTQNYDGSSLEEHFAYIDGEQTIKKSIKTDAKGNVTTIPDENNTEILPLTIKSPTNNVTNSSPYAGTNQSENHHHLVTPRGKISVEDMIETGFGKNLKITNC